MRKKISIFRLVEFIANYGKSFLSDILFSQTYTGALLAHGNHNVKIVIGLAILFMDILDYKISELGQRYNGIFCIFLKKITAYYKNFH